MVSEPILTPLKIIPHKLGNIYRGLRSDEDSFLGFGEAYFSTIHQNETKGWKKHREMTLNLIVPVGEIIFSLYDSTINNHQMVSLSLENYHRLTIPPGWWVAFRGNKKHNLLLNIANIKHFPDESDVRPLEEICFYGQKK